MASKRRQELDELAKDEKQAKRPAAGDSEVDKLGPSAGNSSRSEEGHLNCKDKHWQRAQNGLVNTTPTLDSDDGSSDESGADNFGCDHCSKSCAPNDLIDLSKCCAFICRRCLVGHMVKRCNQSLPLDCPRCERRLSDSMKKKYLPEGVLEMAEEKRGLLEENQRLKKALDLIHKTLVEIDGE